MQQSVGLPDLPENPRSLTLGKIGAQLNLLHRVMTAVGAIMRYRISYRYKGGLWNVWTSKAKLFRVRLVGLLEGKNVQFRVSAINAEGEGEPSEPSKMVLLE